MDNEVKKDSVDVSTLDASANAQVLYKNGLVYKMPQSLSTTVNKTFIKNYAQKQSYLSQERSTIVFDLNTGSKYIDPANSALMFDLIVTANTGVAGTNTYKFDEFNHVSAASCFESILITAKNGTELDRIDHLNYYSMVKNKYGQGQEGGEDMAALSGVGATLLEGVAKRFIVPLCDITGLFNPIIKDMKLPASLISGARIEITLSQAATAIRRVTGDDTNISYEIRDPQITMLAHEINSNTARVLNSESAMNGLEYTYTRAWVTSEKSSGDTINIAVKKAVAQGLRAWTLPIPNNNKVNELASSYTSKDSDLLDGTSYSYRVGSNFYPQQKITSKEEALYVTYDAFGKNHDKSYKGTSITQAEFDGQILVLGVGLETDSRLNLSGTPINNSNSLELEARFDPTEAAANGGTEYITCLEYVCVARSFLTNVTVKL